jgi:hypothetical protein
MTPTTNTNGERDADRAISDGELGAGPGGVSAGAGPGDIPIAAPPSRKERDAIDHPDIVVRAVHGARPAGDDPSHVADVAEQETVALNASRHVGLNSEPSGTGLDNGLKPHPPITEGEKDMGIDFPSPAPIAAGEGDETCCHGSPLHQDCFKCEEAAPAITEGERLREERLRREVWDMLEGRAVAPLPEPIAAPAITECIHSDVLSKGEICPFCSTLPEPIAAGEEDVVVPFTGITKLDLPAERIIGGAAKANLDAVVIIGFDGDGDFFFSANKADGGEVLWLMELARKKLMEIGDQ